MSAQQRKTDTDATLARTERAGLRIVLMVRNTVVALMMIYALGTQGLEAGWFGAVALSVFLVIGLAYRVLVVREADRQWMRFAFVALDMGLVAVAAVTIPLSLHGEVPQIFVFRVYGIVVFFFLLALSALSLSPRLVLWTGAMAVLAIWGAWAGIAFQMDHWVTWADLPAERTAAKYIEIVLNPDHVGVAHRVTETIFLTATSIVTAAAVQRARRLLGDQIAAEQARGRVAEVFGRFVPEEVVDQISDAGGTLPPVRRQASVLFVDIEGFTRFAEGAAPDRIVEVLDAFFDRVTRIINEERGVVISFIGDAAMGSFNAPLPVADHASRALRAARAILADARDNRYAGEVLSIRIGIATGPVAAATVGGYGRRAYTLYGDTVNLAQRLEAMNKDTGTRLLVDQTTWDAAKMPGEARSMGAPTIRGRAQPINVIAPDVVNH